MTTATKSKSMTRQEALDLRQQAHEAGLAAMQAATPTPILWGSPSTPLGSDVDLTNPHSVSTEGVCGFAWVKVKGQTSFARHMRDAGFGRTDSYAGGTNLWVREGGQSLERKEAYANAFAAVLNEAGVSAYAYSRMD